MGKEALRLRERERRPIVLEHPSILSSKHGTTFKPRAFIEVSCAWQPGPTDGLSWDGS